MLVELRVKDLGIVDDLALVLGRGMVAITGETGAGKTLLVEAVELLVGGRADPGLVRAGAAEARVEGRFVVAGDADADGEGGGEREHVLARVVPAEGRSRAYLDGRLATAAELADVGRRLVDLHGQHAHQSLLAPATQRAALDAWAGEEAAMALGEYRAARRVVREVDEALDALGGDPHAAAREVDLLRFQLDEIAAAAVEDPEEDTRLAGEIELLADATAHREALAGALEHVEGPGRGALGEALAALRDRAPFAELADRLEAITVEVDEVARDLHGTLEALDADPERLGTLQARRQVLGDLRRKYGPELADVIAYANTARARLDDLTSADARREELVARRRAAEGEAAAAARTLHRARVKAAGPLADAVTGHLHDLALPHARLEVAVSEGEPGEDGADAVEVRFAANPGEPLRPLAKVASGGELARTMLGLRVVLSAGPPTLVFDEVDAGIGGEAALAVGRLLARVAEDHQVFCVTHLAQVAAFADTQIAVRKRSDVRAQEERTVAEATVLDGAERVAELSRMLAGVVESRHAREHAAELLEAARRA